MTLKAKYIKKISVITIENQPNFYLEIQSLILLLKN